MVNLSQLPFCRVYSISIQSTYYSKNACVVAAIVDDIPEFYQICEFIITPPPTSEVLFVCTQMVTEYYLTHYHAYKVSTTNNYKIIRHKELHDFHPLQCITLRDSYDQVIMPKYHLFSFNVTRSTPDVMC